MPCPLMNLLVGAPFAWMVQRLLGWCNVSSVGALLALASGKAERRQVHPLSAPPKILLNEYLLNLAVSRANDVQTLLELSELNAVN